MTPPAVVPPALKVALCLALVAFCAADSCSCTQRCSPNWASNSCTDCEVGKYMPPAQCSYNYDDSCETPSSCTSCPAGKNAQHTGSASCGTCPSGAYSSTGAGTCKLCQSGHFSSGGDGSCTVCPSGKYAPSAGSSGCFTCPSGKFSVTGGDDATHGSSVAGSDTTCIDGTFTGAFPCACVPCSERADSDSSSRGWWSTAGQSTCTACSAGRYGYEWTSKAAGCAACPFGKYQDATGQSTCLSCPVYCPAGADPAKCSATSKLEHFATQVGDLQQQIGSQSQALDGSIQTAVQDATNTIRTLNQEIQGWRQQITDDQKLVDKLNHETIWHDLETAFKVISGVIAICSGVGAGEGIALLVGEVKYAHTVYSTVSAVVGGLKKNQGALTEEQKLQAQEVQDKASIDQATQGIAALDAAHSKLGAMHTYLDASQHANSMLASCVTSRPCAAHIGKVLPLLGADEIEAADLAAFVTAAQGTMSPGISTAMATYANLVLQEIAAVKSWYEEAQKQNAFQSATPLASNNALATPTLMGSPAPCASAGAFCACNGTVSAQDSFSVGSSAANVVGGVSCSRSVFPSSTLDPTYSFRALVPGYLLGCSLGCKAFDTLAAAQAACSAETTCGGVTKQAGLFQLRSSSSVTTPSTEVSSIKSTEKDELACTCSAKYRQVCASGRCRAASASTNCMRAGSIQQVRLFLCPFRLVPSPTHLTVTFPLPPFCAAVQRQVRH